MYQKGVSPIEPILELMCEMDVVLISLGLTLALLGISRHLIMQCPDTIKRSSQLRISETACTHKLQNTPSTVQNFCFMRNRIALRKYRKEAPDDNDSHSFLFFFIDGQTTRRKWNETKETTIRTLTRIKIFNCYFGNMGACRL
ncbi:hypothetical protein [Fictibacillus enclensis]|uniref:hypothetical protein n=1 Tax=Fictibacillus enclensis TaxID=1017270 RepID=UPI000A4B5231|nr:hypothetical protein [Fictibacillus enclensis]